MQFSHLPASKTLLRRFVARRASVCYVSEVTKIRARNSPAAPSLASSLNRVFVPFFQHSFTEGYIIFLFSLLLFTDIGSVLSQTGWVARGVLALLLIFSIVSWAMIFQKLGFFGRIRRESNQFLRIFRATRGVANPQALASAGSPFASVYASGFRELQSQVGTGTGNPSSNGKLRSLTAVNVSMQLASAEEVRRAEKGMSWLATTASVSPFIGLFGTVWGIIDAFSGLGAAGSASLRAVAPGISEALFTTAAGLATAIPAVIFYNHFLQSIRDLAGRLDTFAMEVAAQIEKTFG